MLVFHFKGQGHHKYNYKVSKENLTVVKEYLVTNICSGNAYQNKPVMRIQWLFSGPCIYFEIGIALFLNIL